QAQPVLRLDPAEESGDVRTVELGVAVHAQHVPDREERAQQLGTTQAPEVSLQILRRGAVEPDHEIGVGLETG
ncbi:hypothetical protein ABE10_01885, partial [Bacillus toyonensis]|nr:hypothetical protein [Bacillus toyonensis]